LLLVRLPLLLWLLLLLLPLLLLPLLMYGVCYCLLISPLLASAVCPFFLP
jgi:hypothetical protein